MGVLAGRRGRGAPGSKSVPELRCEQRVPIVENVVPIAQEAIAHIGHVPRDLAHPPAVRLVNNTRYLHAPRLEVNHDEHEVSYQARQGDNLHREEVHPGDRTPVRFQERSPAHALVAFRGWPDAVLEENALGGRAPDLVSDVRQRAFDARVAPIRVVRCHVDDQLGNPVFNARSTGTTRPAAIILPGNEFPVPS